MSLYPMVRRTITGIFFRDIEAVVASYRVYVRPYLWRTSLFPSASVRDIRTEGKFVHPFWVIDYYGMMGEIKQIR
jgi:hypothetical protein